MSSSSQPPLPAWLSHLPVSGGLAVPWITPRTADGRHLFGTVDRDLMNSALTHCRCGVCGKPLDSRTVLLLRLSDLPRRCTSEPGLHPQCAAYTTQACPMVAGQMDHYRASPRPLDPGQIPAPDAAARQGAPAEPWFAAWVAGYDVIMDHGNLAASYARRAPLRIRSVSWSIPGIW